MTTFLQLHILTSYPPANLNRDDSGQPKTAMMGGTLRGRVSSQSLKRAWRTSNVFAGRLEGHIGTRTRRLGESVMQRLIAAGKREDDAREIASKVAAIFATVDEEEAPWTGQLVHLSPAEEAALHDLAERLAAGKKVNLEQEDLLGNADGAADIAMFGRMLADKPDHSVEAAVQVAPAITTHRVTIEDDFFTAVDDLKPRAEDIGAGYVGEQEFFAGLFYLYLCINRDLLLRNMGKDNALARTALRALAEAALTVGPRGKQASYASRAYASFALAERGPQQPRGLSVAFLDAVSGSSFLKESIDRLHQTCEQTDAAYGPCAEARYTLNVAAREGTLAGLLDFVGE